MDYSGVSLDTEDLRQALHGQTHVLPCGSLTQVEAHRAAIKELSNWLPLLISCSLIQIDFFPNWAKTQLFGISAIQSLSIFEVSRSPLF